MEKTTTTTAMMMTTTIDDDDEKVAYQMVEDFVPQDPNHIK